MYIIVELFSNDKYEGKDWPSDNAIEFILGIEEKISSIPEELRESAMIDISTICDHASIAICCQRQTTEEEIKEHELRMQKMSEFAKRVGIAAIEEFKRKHEQ